MLGGVASLRPQCCLLALVVSATNKSPRLDKDSIWLSLMELLGLIWGQPTHVWPCGTMTTLISFPMTRSVPSSPPIHFAVLHRWWSRPSGVSSRCRVGDGDERRTPFCRGEGQPPPLWRLLRLGASQVMQPRIRLQFSLVSHGEPCFIPTFRWH